MRKRLMIGAAFVCLIGGSAYAQEEGQAPESGAGAEAAPQCEQQLASAQEAVQDKVDANALSEADAEKIYLLLDEADAFCTEGNGEEASARLATVNKMIGKDN